MVDGLKVHWLLSGALQNIFFYVFRASVVSSFGEQNGYRKMGFAHRRNILRMLFVLVGVALMAAATPVRAQP
jgi:hypothetical protein